MSNLATAMWPECRVPSGGQSDATETAQLVPRDAFLPHYREQRWQVSEMVQGACLQWSPRSVSRWRRKKGNPGRTAEETYAHKCTGFSLAIQRWAMPQLHFRNQVYAGVCCCAHMFAINSVDAKVERQQTAITVHFSPRWAATPICSNVTGRLQTFL